MDKYSIILPNEKARTYNYIMLFILAINLMLQAFIFFSASTPYFRICSFIATATCIFSAVMMLSKRKSRTHFPAEITFFILSFLWLLMGRYLLCLCVACFAVAGIYSRKKKAVVFSHENICYPSFPKRLFLWREVSNVLLKDGMLTIDLKTNKLMQSVISKESAADTDEKAFNLFCAERLQEKS